MKRANINGVGLEWLNPNVVIPKQSLVVAKAKVSQVEQFFNTAVDGTISSTKCHVLVITGPSGSGKSSLIRSLCQHLCIDIVLLDDLINVDYNADLTNDLQFLPKNGNNCFASSITNSKFPTLAFLKPPSRAKARGKVTLIDDIEGLGEKSVANLLKILKGSTRGVFAITCSDWYDFCRHHRGWRDLVSVDCLSVEHVSLNLLAPTFLRKAILYWGGDASELSEAMIDMGNVRTCLNSLYLKSLFDNNNDTGTETANQADENLTLFHALGRLFYPLKRKERDLWNPTVPDDRSLFHSYIHANMFQHLQTLKEADKLLDALSMDAKYERANFYYCECTLSMIINDPGRQRVKVRPVFVKPEPLNIVRK